MTTSSLFGCVAAYSVISYSGAVLQDETLPVGLLRVCHGVSILPFGDMNCESCGVLLAFEIHMVVSFKMHLHLDVIAIADQGLSFSRKLVWQNVALMDFLVVTNS